ARRARGDVENVDRRQVRLSVDGRDFRAQPNRDVRLPAQLIDEVARHAFFQRVATHQEGDAARMVGEVERRLAGRVARADEVEVEPVARTGLAARRTIVDALSDQSVEAFDGE